MTGSWLRRMLSVGLMLLVISAVAAGAALAHPLGNITTNAAAQLSITPTDLGVDYVLDVAEIPAVQTIAVIDATGDGTLDDGERSRWGRRRCAELAAGLDLAVDGRSRTLAVDDVDVSLPQGEAGLDTLRLECDMRAEIGGTGWQAAAPRDAGAGRHAVRLRDRNDLGRAGWREITATASGARIIDSDVPASSPTGLLRSYPPDQLTAPLRVQTANVTVAPGTGDRVAVTTPFCVPGDTVAAGFTALVARRELTVGFAAFAVIVAVALGASHALAPGHGKTVIAAFLVGTRGGARHAAVLGLTVAASHTAGAWILGAVISASQTLAPDRVSVACGDQRCAVHRGGRRAAAPVTGRRTTRTTTPTRATTGMAMSRSVAASRGAGIGGGLVPSPSAVVVLLGGIALGRTWFGVALVAAYGVGIAASPVGAGHLLARMAHRLRGAGRQTTRGLVRRVTVALPTITSALVLVGGLVIAGRGLAAL